MNRQIANGAVASLLYMATVVLVSMVQLRLVVQMLPPNIAGVWLLFMTIGAYVAFFDLGINPTIGREISFLSAASGLIEPERNKRIAELLNTVRLAFYGIAFCVGAVTLVVGEIIISRYAQSPVDFSLGPAWVLFSVGASLNLIGGPNFAALFGLGHVAAEKVIRSISLLIGLALTILFLKLRWAIVGLALAWLLQNGLAILIAHYYLRRKSVVSSGMRISPNWNVAKKLAAPSLKLAAIQLGAVLILQSANPIIAVVIGTVAIPRY